MGFINHGSTLGLVQFEVIVVKGSALRFGHLCLPVTVTTHEVNPKP